MNDPSKNKSYFKASIEELQKLIDKYYGTGEAYVYPDGQIKEIVDVGSPIGIVISQTGDVIGTTAKIKIHYSKGRTHIVPTKEKKS
ncbi:MAG: polymorphic toxin type 50 domain-containing protein [Ruminococcus sp.]|nr:polymorphic toxin type 50 domain-containing protein [Ruminococcus sp.]